MRVHNTYSVVEYSEQFIDDVFLFCNEGMNVINSLGCLDQAD